MKTLLIWVVLMGTAAADTVKDAMGHTTGRTVSDGRGTTTFYDAMGRQRGRTVTNSAGTIVYDAMGRQTGTIRK